MRRRGLHATGAALTPRADPLHAAVSLPLPLPPPPPPGAPRLQPTSAREPPQPGEPQHDLTDWAASHPLPRSAGDAGPHPPATRRPAGGAEPAPRSLPGLKGARARAGPLRDPVSQAVWHRPPEQRLQQELLVQHLAFEKKAASRQSSIADFEADAAAAGQLQQLIPVPPPRSRPLAAFEPRTKGFMARQGQVDTYNKRGGDGLVNILSTDEMVAAAEEALRAGYAGRRGPPLKGHHRPPAPAAWGEAAAPPLRRAAHVEAAMAGAVQESWSVVDTGSRTASPRHARVDSPRNPRPESGNNLLPPL